MTDRNSEFQVAMRMFASVIEDNSDQIDNFCKHGGNPNYKFPPNNYTLLHIAAGNMKPKSIRKLIEYGGDIDYLTLDNCTPLHCAIRNNREEIVQLLLDLGANHTITRLDEYRETAMDLAKYHKNEKIITILENHVAAKATDAKPAGKRK